jgi:DNA polymerase elongation subunit (family B)
MMSELKPVSERAIPVVVFRTDNQTLKKKKCLRSWLGQQLPSEEQRDRRNILDWDYYIARLSSAILKMVAILAVLQNVANPTPPRATAGLAGEAGEGAEGEAISEDHRVLEEEEGSRGREREGGREEEGDWRRY